MLNIIKFIIIMSWTFRATAMRDQWSGQIKKGESFTWIQNSSSPKAIFLKEQIEKTLSDHFDLDVDIKVEVDEEILGGIIVQMGSKMIDSSLLTRLKSIKNVMNEA